MSRSEFTVKTRMDAWDRCKGKCELCGAKLWVGKFAFDHIKADGLGGKPTLDNCQVLCDACHGIKTHTQDRPITTKADNQKKAFLGITPRTRAAFPKHIDPWGKAWRSGRMEKE